MNTYVQVSFDLAFSPATGVFDKMRLDDFLASIDRTSPVSVNEQVAALLGLLPEEDYMRFNNARAAMPDDVNEAYSLFIRSKYQPAQVRAGRKVAREKRIHVTITLPASLVDRLPYPRSSFVERALLTALGE